MITFWAILKRDVMIAWRASGGVAQSAAFFTLFVSLTPFALGSNPVTLSAAAPGLFWFAALLGTLLGLERIIQPDAEDGTLDLLRLSPLPLELVATAKLLANWLTAGVTVSVLAPLLAPILNLSFNAITALALSLAIGTLGLSAIGTAAAALGASVQRGGLIVAIMVMPLYVPFLIFGTNVVASAQANGDIAQSLMMLTACSLIALVVGAIAAAAALRLNDE